MENPGLLQLIGSGASADVLRIGKGLVLKLFRPGIDPGIIQREIDAASRAIDEGLLVPRPVGRRSIDGRDGVIFEEVRGLPLFEQLAGWRVDRARAALRKLAGSHARIHRGNAEGMIHDQRIILHVRIESADTDPALKRLALDRLWELPHGDSLCHGDFHPRNAIETNDGIAAIDWSNGCTGDPAGDVARTELLLRYGLHGKLTRNFAPARWLRHAAANFYLGQYMAISGMAAERIAAWRLPVAVSALVAGSRVNRAALMAALEGRAPKLGEGFRVVGAAGLEPATPAV